ncbi:MAG: tetratricopeptide repeat protein [Lachnospiraceae bacterium]|nr:tetratricopeptide repeat protein [Lachnospiraceae bacterium]
MKRWFGVLFIVLMLCSGCQNGAGNRWQLAESARTAMAEENYSLAVEYYDQLVEMELEDSGIFNDRGAAKLELQEYSSALEDLEKAVELDNTNPTYWYNLGLCRSLLNDYEGGVEAFTQALLLEPEYAECLGQRGVSYAHLGEEELAELDIEAVGRLNPESQSAFWAELGSIYMEKCLYNKAEEAFGRAISLEVNNAELYLQRANVYMLTQEYKKAQEDLVRAIDMQESFLAGYELMGDLYYIQQEYKQAIAYYSVALLEEADYLGHLNRGCCYHALGEFEEAEADFTAAILMEPESAAAYNCRAQVREELGNVDGAKEDYKKAKDILEEGAKENGK